MVNPYHFVPIDVNLAVTDKPVWHDGNNPDQKQLLSGELQCTMTTLTPILVGNYHYNMSQAIGLKSPNGEDIHDYIKKKIEGTQQAIELQEWQEAATKKTVIEPLRLKDGRIVIPGTSIKGMLRHSLSALLSAPMERVWEQKYGYRPNNMRIVTAVNPVSRPAIIGAKGSSGDININIINNPDYVVFVKPDAVTVNIETCADSGTIYMIEPNLRIHEQTGRNKLEWGRPPCAYTTRFRVFKYFGGLDGTDTLAKGGNTYSYVLIPEIDVTAATPGIISRPVVDNYFSTLGMIGDDQHGHIGSRHPNITDSLANQVKQNIKRLRRLFNDDYLQIQDKLMIYIEKNTAGTILSMGHNFRYICKYRDSIHNKNKVPRDILTPLQSKETGKATPDLLSTARLLFGYVVSEDIGTKGIGEGDYAHLAGRIAINHAVEVIVDKDNKIKTEKQRFMNDLFLKELGSPKASAVEHYLSQDDHSRFMNTYGHTDTDPHIGELNGRKFYLHQPDAKVTPGLFSDTSDEIVRNPRAAIARFVSNPGTHFKFTVRYRDLRKWEFGLLKLSLELMDSDIEAIATGNNAVSTYIAEVKKQNGRHFAHKIGHGKPLGLGSVTIKIDNKKDILSDTISCLKKKLEECFTNGKNYSDWQNQILLPWLKVHQYAGRTSCEYPNVGGQIFRFHSEARGNQLTIRRGGSGDIQKYKLRRL